MSNVLTITTTETQSTFAMPTYGHARGTSCAPAPIFQGSFDSTVVPVRDRRVAALVKGAFPGTSVWRPPS